MNVDLTIGLTAMELPFYLQAPDFRVHEAELRRLSPAWLHGEVYARESPNGVALVSRYGTRTYAQLHDNANRMANALVNLGLRKGDAVALMCRNRPEFVEVLLASMRLGLRLTPVSTQLTRDEAAYIVSDCDAKHLFVEVGLPGDSLDGVPLTHIGSLAYEALLAQSHPANPPDAGGGMLMPYTSGTTGKPKGVRRVTSDVFFPQFAGTLSNYRPTDVQLCAGPAYHAAPLLIDVRWPVVSGVPIVMLDKWDSEQVLATIHHYKVSCAHFVPTMFRRLLDLPAHVRAKYDLSSLRHVVHGAAPCSRELKQATIDWLGPVLWEYYGATEGGDGINVNAQDWLKHPGTVGRLLPEFGHRVVDADGKTCAPGQVGRVWLNAQQANNFCYHKDEEKTAQAFQLGGLLLGDEGYLDDEGWLFLTGRSAEVIISGGVNIYPVEIDDVLRRHPAVADAACAGAPDDEWGERVVALVVRITSAEGDDVAVRESLIAHASANLARYKCPRDILFVAALPYSATGKLLRSQIRNQFWAGQERKI